MHLKANPMFDIKIHVYTKLYRDAGPRVQGAQSAWAIRIWI